jgi:2'-5' RNA ligase
MNNASDCIEARATIGTLQAALDRTNARIRELDLVHATLNARLAAANDRADALESALWRLQAIHSISDVST